MNQDKGQKHQILETLKKFRADGAAPIEFDQLVTGMQVIFAARRSLVSGQPIEVVPYKLQQHAST